MPPPNAEAVAAQAADGNGAPDVVVEWDRPFTVLTADERADTAAGLRPFRS